MTDKPEYNRLPKVLVENQKEKVYVEQYDINSKYDRMPREKHNILYHLCLAQMVKMYVPCWKEKQDKHPEDEEEIENSCYEDDVKEIKDESLLSALSQTNKSQESSLYNCPNKKPNETLHLTLDQYKMSNKENTMALSHSIKISQESTFLSFCKNTKSQEDSNLALSQHISQKDTTLAVHQNIKKHKEGHEWDNSDNKFNQVMACEWWKGEGPLLPTCFKLNDPYPGEPPYMKLRTKPAVLRFHKYKIKKDPDAYWFSEAILFLPHDSEQDLKNKIQQAKSGGSEAWDLFVKKISYVKSQVIEFLEDNEEARMMAAEMIIDNALTGEFMDPEGEQEQDDNRMDTFVPWEEFEHLDPEYTQTDQTVFEKSFRPIEVRPLQDLSKEARKLDFFQRKVLQLGIRHARALVKARSGKNTPPNRAPLVMVDGAAGSGN